LKMTSRPVNFVKLHVGGGYESDSGRHRSANYYDMGKAPQTRYQGPVPGSGDPSLHYTSFQQKESRRSVAASMREMDAYSRHRKLIDDYIKYYNGKPEDLQYKPEPGLTDYDVLKQAHRFVRTAEDDADSSWDQRLAKKYYDKLFKEYCLADMSRYKEGKVGLRWRTQDEVMKGKGQFVCGNKKCDEVDDLKSYEVNFAYVEGGVRKQALVKLRLCSRCAYKLNYRKIQEMEKAEEAQRKKEKDEKRRQEKEKKKEKKMKKEKKKGKEKEKAKKTKDQNEGSDSEDIAEQIEGQPSVSIPSSAHKRRRDSDHNRADERAEVKQTNEEESSSSSKRLRPDMASLTTSPSPSSSTPTSTPSAPAPSPSLSSSTEGQKRQTEEEAFEGLFL